MVNRGSCAASQPAVRLAGVSDAGRIAVLCGQLGYPSTPREVEDRLDRILADDRHAVYIAQEDGQVVGWVHVCARPLVGADLQAEIGGLVVDERFHGRGLGRRLMRAAERWAGERGCRAVLLRSNVVREGAHRFYERIGYENVKTSLTFRKALTTQLTEDRG